MNSHDYLSPRKNRLQQLLADHLPAASTPPTRLHTAMRYTVLGNGKCLRPLLVYATGETLGAELTQLDAAACAIELIHAYSLVHDDLPAMDNDDLRRGQPTCHKKFDEATAILVGDGLQTLAFEILANNENSNLSPQQRLQMLAVLAKASGSQGMVGGQALEFEFELETTSNSQQSNIKQLENIHLLKTGALIRASVHLGAIAAGATDTQLENLDQFATHLGLAFQIQDDILDHTHQQDKFSYLNHLTLPAAQARLQELYAQAINQLSSFGPQAQPLHWMTDFIKP